MDLDTDLEPRKEKLKRRSSILKMPVPMSPTERTAEITATATTTTTKRLSRRVSFADRFHVQEFCTDGQRATMWTDAYEQPAHVTYSSEESSAAGHRLLNTTCSLPAGGDGEVPQPYVVAPRKSFAPRTSTSSSSLIDTDLAKGYPPAFETRPISDADKENVVPRHLATPGATHGDINDTLVADNVFQDVNVPRAGLASSGAAGSGLVSLFGSSEPLETPPFLRNLSEPAGMRRDYLQSDNYQTPTFLRTSSAPILSSGGPPTDLGPVGPGSLLDIIGGQGGPAATPPFLRDLTPTENTGRDEADERLLRLFGDNQLDTPLFLRQADRPEYSLDRSPWGGSETGVGRAWIERDEGNCQEGDDWLVYPKLADNSDRLVNQTVTVGVDMDVTRDVSLERTALDPGYTDLTQPVPFGLPEKPAEKAVNTTRRGAADMELTEAVPRDLPVKLTAVNTTRCGAADMELTEAVPRDLPVKPTSTVNTTRCGAADMELTEAVPRDLPVKPTSAVNTTRCGTADMELTEAVPRDLPVKPTSAVNTTRCGTADMELTEAVPRDLPVKPTSAVNTTRCGTADMELTEAVPRDLPVKPTSAINTTKCGAADMELTEAVPRDLPVKPTSAVNTTRCGTADMELTEAVPRDLPVKPTSAINTTKCGAADMELTEAVPRDLSVKPPSAVNTTRCGGADMELTEVVPRDLPVKPLSAVNTTRCGAADMELTEAVPRDLPVKSTSAVNTTRCGAADMELTEAVPRDLPVKPTSAVNTTRCGAADMELTEAVPRDLPVKPTSVVNTTRCGAADMELTEAVPRDLPVKPTSAVNTTRCGAADMELTEAVPRDLPVKPSSAVNTTRCGAADMELTEAVPRDLPVKPTSAVNTTRCGAADMELIEAVPRDLPVKSTSAVNTTRAGAADMELTEAVPRDLPVKSTSAVNTTRCGAADLQLTEAVPQEPVKLTAVNTTRSDAAGMELTKPSAQNQPIEKLALGGGNIFDSHNASARSLISKTLLGTTATVEDAYLERKNSIEAADMTLAESLARGVSEESSLAIDRTTCPAADTKLTEAPPQELPVGKSTLDERSGLNPHDVSARHRSSNKKPTSFPKSSAGGMKRCSGFPSTCAARPSRMSEVSVSSLDPSLLVPTDVCCDPECSAAGHHLTLGLTLGASCFGTVCDLTDLPEHPSELLEEDEESLSGGSGSRVAAAPAASSESPDEAETGEPQQQEADESGESLDLSLRLEGSGVDTPTGSQNKSATESASEPTLADTNYGSSASAPDAGSPKRDVSASLAVNPATENGQTAFHTSRHVSSPETISEKTLLPDECATRPSEESSTRRSLFATSVASGAAPFIDDVFSPDVASEKSPGAGSVMGEDPALANDSAFSGVPTSSVATSHVAPLPDSLSTPAAQPSLRYSSGTFTDLQGTTESVSASAPATVVEGAVAPLQTGTGVATESTDAADEARTTPALSAEEDLPDTSTSRSQSHVETDAVTSGALTGCRRPPAISPRRTPIKRRRPNRLAPCQSSQEQLSPQQLQASAGVEDGRHEMEGGRSILGGDSPEGVVPPKRGRGDAESAVEAGESPRSPKSPRLEEGTVLPPLDHPSLATTAPTEGGGVTPACNPKRPDHASECGHARSDSAGVGGDSTLNVPKGRVGAPVSEAKDARQRSRQDENVGTIPTSSAVASAVEDAGCSSSETHHRLRPSHIGSDRQRSVSGTEAKTLDTSRVRGSSLHDVSFPDVDLLDDVERTDLSVAKNGHASNAGLQLSCFLNASRNAATDILNHSTTSGVFRADTTRDSVKTSTTLDCGNVSARSCGVSKLANRTADASLPHETSRTSSLRSRTSFTTSASGVSRRSEPAPRLLVAPLHLEPVRLPDMRPYWQCLRKQLEAYRQARAAAAASYLRTVKIDWSLIEKARHNRMREDAGRRADRK